MQFPWSTENFPLAATTLSTAAGGAARVCVRRRTTASTAPSAAPAAATVLTVEGPQHLHQQLGQLALCQRPPVVHGHPYGCTYVCARAPLLTFARPGPWSSVGDARSGFGLCAPPAAVPLSSLLEQQLRLVDTLHQGGPQTLTGATAVGAGMHNANVMFTMAAPPPSMASSMTPAASATLDVWHGPAACSQGRSLAAHSTCTAAATGTARALAGPRPPSPTAAGAISKKKRRPAAVVHTCTVCAYSSVRKGNLVRHARRHTHERPFKCSVAGCGYAASERGALVRHTDLHNGVRKHVCLWAGCGWRTNEPSNLKRHQLTHTHERPHACPHCAYAAAQAGNLRGHLRRRHPEHAIVVPRPAVHKL